MDGFRTLRRILEPHWVSSDVSHPLWQKFWGMSSESNYAWFSRFARILQELTRIPGSGEVIPRLGIPKEYWNALNELDFALKIHLAEIPCKFVSRGSTKTPDLTFDHRNRSSFVEITSLNTSEQEQIAMDTELWLSGEQFRHHCRAGWSLYWDRQDFDALSIEIRETALGAFDEAVRSKRLVNRTIPGIFDIYVTPEDHTELMPKKYAGISQVSARTPLPVRDRIARIIDRKARGQLNSQESSILVFYDRISSETVRQLSDDHSIPVKIATLPNFAAVVLIHPIWNPFAVSNVKVGVEVKWDLTVINHQVPNGEAEECLLWENSEEKGHSETIQLLKECLEEYPVNLARLLKRPLA